MPAGYAEPAGSAGRVQIASAWQQIRDAEAQLAEAEAELQDGEAQLADGETELADGQAELDQNRKMPWRNWQTPGSRLTRLKCPHGISRPGFPERLF